MPYSSGSFTLVASNPVVTGTTISSTWANNTLSDLATGLSTCVLKDGSQTVTANIPMNSFKFTGLAAGAVAGNSVRYEQVLLLDGTNTMTGRMKEAAMASVASAATVNLDTSGSNYVQITGTTTITAITLTNGQECTVEFAGALTLTNGASLILPSGANITTAAGDTAIFRGEAASVVRCISYIPASGKPIIAGTAGTGIAISGATISTNLSTLSNFLAANVSLSNTANYFTGPSVAQGSSGTWFFSGTVTVTDATGGAVFSAKLTDGATIIASTRATQIAAANTLLTISLSGVLSSPAGNVSIQVKDETTTGGTVLANTSGNNKDSTLTAIRIA